MFSPGAKIARIAERQHAVFTGTQARACGMSQDAIDRRVAAGLWLREHTGLFRIGGAPRTFESDALGAVLAAGRNVVASFTTAGRLFGLDGIDDGAVHVTVVGRRHVRVDGVFVHRPRVFTKPDATRIGVIPVTTPARTLIDLAAMLDPTTLEDAIDDARRRNLINVNVLSRRVEKMNPHGRRGVLTLRRFLRERIGLPIPGSNWERRLQRLLTEHGLPRPVPQYEILDGDGNFVARPDLAYPDERLYIEFESEEFHSRRSDWEDDLERQNELVALGYAPIRVSKRQMTTAPDRVVAHVSGRLTAAHAARRAQT